MEPGSEDLASGYSKGDPQKLVALRSKSEKERTAELTPALLVEAAAIENRLRQHVLELLEPALRKVSLFDGKLKEAKGGIDSCERELREFKVEQGGNDVMRIAIDDFRVELAEWDRDRRQHEQKIANKTSLQDNEISSLRASSELQVSSVEACKRGLKSLGNMMNDTKEEFEEVRKYCIDRMDLNRDKIMKLRDEFETKNHAFECDMHLLKDDLTDMSTVFAHLKAEMERIAANTAETMEGVRDLWRTKATVAVVEEQHQGFLEFSRGVDAEVSHLRTQLNNIVDDVKAHFQTAAQVVGTTTMGHISEMREKYSEDLKGMQDIVKEHAGMMERQEIFQEAVQNDVSVFQDEIFQKVESIKTSFEGKSQTSTSESNKLMLEAMQLKKQLKDLESAEKVAQSLRAISRDVLTTMVESQLLSAHLDSQDDQDRKNIALFGYKNVENKESRTSIQGGFLPELDPKLTPRRRIAQVLHADKPTINLDKRCLSCSGSPATTLAGFKLACLQYSPSAVEYRRVSYSRAELISLRLDLLHQAQEQLKAAPG
mmetsp:Transcript_75144/g.135351  ORF Transcript_75144/g.135351 Transcript_75144/m.135351 type:complete len:543 (+) Transcript_75144:86-1714(+)